MTNDGPTYYRLVDEVPKVRTSEQKHWRAKPTGEVRDPKRGEWYIHKGMGYRSFEDMQFEFPIAELVKGHMEMVMVWHPPEEESKDG